VFSPYITVSLESHDEKHGSAPQKEGFKMRNSRVGSNIGTDARGRFFKLGPKQEHPKSMILSSYFSMEVPNEKVLSPYQRGAMRL